MRINRDPGHPAAEATAAIIVSSTLLGVYATVLLRTAWLSDDAYITFRTIDNWIGGHGLRWNVAERVQAFTHPLWLLFLASIYTLTREIYLTALVSSMLISLGTIGILWWQSKRRNRDPWVVAGGLAILIVSRAFVDYSTSGLENPLTHLLLVGFMALLLDEQQTNPRKLLLLSLIAGLAILNRLDTALLFVPVLALELWHSRSWSSILGVLLGLAPLFLWEAFSLVYYGFLFPNTAYAKLQTGISRLEYCLQGLRYFKNSLAWDPVTLTAIGGGTIVGLFSRNKKRSALAAGMMLYLLYVVTVGGDYMSGRFFTPPLLMAVMLFITADSTVIPISLRRLFPLAVMLVGCIGRTPTFFSGTDYGTVGGKLDGSGIADERAFYYPTTGLLSPQPIAERPSCQTSEAARNARLRHDPLIVDGVVGFAGFFAGPKTHIVDYNALGDPLLSRLPSVRPDPYFTNLCMMQNGRACKGEWRTGHCLRNIPAGYLDSILADENRLVDENLRKFYEPIRLITRGPIWSARRWLAIAKMNLGLYDSLLGPARQEEYHPTAFLETYERHPEIFSVSLLTGAADDYARRGLSDKAIELYQKLIVVDARNSMAWNNLSWLLLGRGDAPGRAAVTDSIALVDGEVDARQLGSPPLRTSGSKLGRAEAEYSLGAALVRQGRTHEATQHLQRALLLRADYPEAHNDLGVALVRTGSVRDLQAAIGHFQEALRLKPDLPNAHRNLDTALLMESALITQTGSAS